ncbi:MFS transporter [Parapusillimonas sp. JC17]|uniref:MFS transporter n=1 Tax=Parapusillimonas sp. JC17 TaxID=3445768 RepID=UPI003F9F6684
MTALSGSATAARKRRPLRDILLACMVVLLLAQGLIGALSLSALKHLAADNTAERVELLARRTSAQIQMGMSLGKPLAQFFGLSALLDELRQEVPDFRAAAVVLADGTLLDSVGDPAGFQDMLGAWSVPAAQSAGMSRTASGAVHKTVAGDVVVAVPLRLADASVGGAVVLQVAPRDMRQAGLMLENARVLVGITLAAALLLALIFRYAMPLHELASASRARMVFPLLILLLAQGVYAAYTVNTFRSVWMDVTQDNTRIVGRGLQQDLNRVLGYGVAPGSLRGVEQPMARLAASFPVISELRLLSREGTVLNRADAHGRLPVEEPLPEGQRLVFPLSADGQGPASATLEVFLDEDRISDGVRARILDAATVVAVAMVAAIELLLLLALMMDRAFAVPARRTSGDPLGLDDQSKVGALVRPVMFGFLFAMALPLSFLPIYARSLLSSADPGQEAALLMALPIAVEMGCGLLTALLAGRLADRRGWQWPVLSGLAVSVAGNLACALAGSLAELTLARALVGLGYGLTWMGLQGFIVIRSPAAYRGRNMATVIAGLFAGHLSGAAVGAMLAQQVGPSAVFSVGAFLLALPALGVFTLMWPYRHIAGQKAASVAAGPIIRSWSSVARLLATRDFGMLLIGSIVPFSIAQVGLLTYALPLYMEAQGGTAASVGRVLMLYGFCVIYIGPWMGRLADRSANKKHWIALGGLVGSVGLLSLYFATGVYAAAVAVVLLALASCLAGGAQTAYMLSLNDVQQYGPGGATSVMRAADKFGQMLGPLAVGGLFASMGISGGLAVTGAFYLLATLAFFLVAPGVRPDRV